MARPFTVVGPTAPVLSGRLTVTDGWTGAPVPQARVTMGVEAVFTDAAGQFTVDTTAPCQRTTIVASGYLDRRLNCLPSAGPTQRTAVTLWPVKDDAERSALQVFAFRGRGEILVQPYALILEMQPDSNAAEAITAAWQGAGATLDAASAGAARVHFQSLVDDGAIVSPWSSPADCASAIPAAWPTDVSGFCLGRPVGYFAHMLLVAAHRAVIVDSPPGAGKSTLAARMADERVALRAMLYELGLRPHTLPGLMNATQPADTLSDFERRTLHMLSLRVRRYPLGVAWPDTEF